MVLLTKFIMNEDFEQLKTTQRSFKTAKSKLPSALILALPNFKLIFEVECDASDIGIRAALT